MKNREYQTFSLTNHFCRKCSSRLLYHETPSVVTGGGNTPIQCSGCGWRRSPICITDMCLCGDDSRFTVENPDSSYLEACKNYQEILEKLNQ